MRKKPTAKRADLRRSVAYKILFLFSIVSLVGAVAGAGWLLAKQQDRILMSMYQKIDGESGKAFSLAVDTLVMPIDAQAGLIATSSATKTVIESGDWRKVRLLEQKVEQGIPHLISLRIFPYGTAKLNQDHKPPIKHSTMEIIDAVELKKTISPEVQFIEDKRVLVIAKPIEIDPTAITAAGTVVLFLDFDSILNTLPKLENVSGYVQWVQKVKDAETRTLMELGDKLAKGSDPTWQAQLANANWSIEIHSQRSGALLKDNEEVFVIFGGLAGVCFVLMCVAWIVAFREEKKNLEEEGGSYGIKNVGQRITSFDNRDEAIDTFGTASTSLFDVEVLDDGLGLMDTVEEVDSEEASTGGVDVPQPIPSIFGRSCIRGVYPEEVSVDAAWVIGLAIGTLIIESGEKTLVVGRDARSSSEALSNALVHGLTDTGCQVVQLGQVTTGLFYFATEVSQARSGVMITGGHSDAAENGFKIVYNRMPVTGEFLQKIRILIEKGRLLHGKSGSSASQDISEVYIKKLQSTVKLTRGLRVVVDAMNGVSGLLVERALTAIGCEASVINQPCKGDFPEGPPDPLDPARLGKLQHVIQDGVFDVGFALDGAGERLVIVTPSGKVVWPDRIMAFLAQELLAIHPGNDVVFDVKCGRVLMEEIVSSGGRPVMWKSGYPNIRAKLEETGAIFGGEFTGHIVFNEPGRWYAFDDSIYTIARLLEFVSMQSKGVDYIFEKFSPKPATSELLRQCDNRMKSKVIQCLQEPDRFQGARISTVDGVRIDFPQGWASIRLADNPQFLSMRFEADTDAELQALQKQVEEHIQQILA